VGDKLSNLHLSIKVSISQIIINFIFLIVILFSLYSLYKFELEDSERTISGKILKSSALTVGLLFLIWYLNWFVKLLVRFINYELYI
jgi:hypothetical protein